ncbi:hypothetical protein AB0B44_35625, partial [Streptomyces sp. NPDC041003]
MEIHTSDDAVVDSVVESLTELRARRLDRARNIDPMSVVVIAGAVLTLVNGLLDLQGHLRRRGSGGEAAERTAPEVVGCLVVTAPADGRSEIKRLWTDPEFRGRRIAS